MKKLVLALLLGFCILFSTQTYVHAQSTFEATQSSDFLINQPTSSASSQINYELAYPGLLPDSPLYFLKTLRDKIVGLLINNPVQRAQFNLLTSDKRIRAGQMLVAKHKDDLAITAISKSNNYFSEAISALSKAKSSNKDVSSLVANMKQSILKHEQVMHDLKMSLSKNHDQEYMNELQRMEKFKKILSSYK